MKIQLSPGGHRLLFHKRECSFFLFPPRLLTLQLKCIFIWSIYKHTRTHLHRSKNNPDRPQGRFYPKYVTNSSALNSLSKSINKLRLSLLSSFKGLYVYTLDCFHGILIDVMLNGFCGQIYRTISGLSKVTQVSLLQDFSEPLLPPWEILAQSKHQIHIASSHGTEYLVL